MIERGATYQALDYLDRDILMTATIHAKTDTVKVLLTHYPTAWDLKRKDKVNHSNDENILALSLHLSLLLSRRMIRQFRIWHMIIVVMILNTCLLSNPCSILINILITCQSQRLLLLFPLLP